MLSVFGVLRGVARVRTGSNGVLTYSALSSVHHRLTTPLLILLALMVSARQYLGEPVQCVQHRPGDDAAIPERVMNTYCFVSTTYTVARQYQSRPHISEHRSKSWSHASGAMHPGIYGFQGLGEDPYEYHESVPLDNQTASIRRHAYYQWVPLVLFLQALTFAAPHFFWTQWEGGLVDGALRGLTAPECDIIPSEVRSLRIKTLARYLYLTLNSHVIWAAGYWFTEVCNLINVLINVVLTDALLGGRFYGYGYEVLAASKLAMPAPTPFHPQVDPYPDHDIGVVAMPRPADPGAIMEDGLDPMEEIFPKLTKCTFFKYGPSGSIQRHDALCVMALNVVNEKIFFLLWFWLAGVALLSLLTVAQSTLSFLALSCCKRSALRNRVTLWLFRTSFGLGHVPLSLLGPLSVHLDCGDWLFLHLLGINTSPKVFRALVKDVLCLLGEHPPAPAPAPAQDKLTLEPTAEISAELPLV